MDDVEVKKQRSEDDYFQDRIAKKINAYGRKGDRQKVFYWILATIAATGAALLPALINLSGVPDWVSTVISLIVAIALAVEGIFRPREHWRNYDMIESELRAEEMKYSTKTKPYASDDAFAKLVTRIEELISAERAETILMRTARNSETSEDEAH